MWCDQITFRLALEENILLFISSRYQNIYWSYGHNYFSFWRLANQNYYCKTASICGSSALKIATWFYLDNVSNGTCMHAYPQFQFWLLQCILLVLQLIFIKTPLLIIQTKKHISLPSNQTRVSNHMSWTNSHCLQEGCPEMSIRERISYLQNQSHTLNPTSQELPQCLKSSSTYIFCF